MRKLNALILKGNKRWRFTGFYLKLWLHFGHEQTILVNWAYHIKFQAGQTPSQALTINFSNHGKVKTPVVSQTSFVEHNQRIVHLNGTHYSLNCSIGGKIISRQKVNCINLSAVAQKVSAGLQLTSIRILMVMSKFQCPRARWRPRLFSMGLACLALIVEHLYKNFGMFQIERNSHRVII